MGAARFRHGSGYHKGAACARLLAFCIVLAGLQLAWAVAPGTLLKVTETDPVSAQDIPFQASYAVDSFVIRFATEALDGSTTEVSAHLLVPRLTAPAEVPMYVFATGSTGLADHCAPTTEHIRGANWGNYREHVLAHAGQGLIGVMPDYMGFGDPDMVQPYFIAEAEARVMLDAVRAATAFFEERNANARPSGAFVAGYSQGGHAAFATADLHSDYAAETDLLGVIGYGPTTGVEAVLREFSVVAPLILYAYREHYGESKVDPDQVLAEHWASSLEEDVTTLCIDAIQQHYPLSQDSLYTSEFADALANGALETNYPKLFTLLRKNSSGLGGHDIPALILQGSDDPVVHVDTQNAFVNELCELGTPVQYLHYLGVRHNTRNVGFGDAQAWMHRLAAGEPPTSNC